MDLVVALIKWMSVPSASNKGHLWLTGATVCLLLLPLSPSFQPASNPDLIYRQEERPRGGGKNTDSPQRGRTDAKVIPQHVLTLNITAY